MYNNNFGYNPYYQPQRFTGMPQQPIQQPVDSQNNTINITQNRSILNGKQVESIDVVKAMDIPLDGSISYFPIADGSAIVSKQLQMDGTSKTIVYKPVTEEPKETLKYITVDDLNKAIEKIDLSDIDDLKDDIKDIKSELKDLKKKKKED